jgi:hypothetical protein
MEKETNQNRVRNSLAGGGEDSPYLIDVSTIGCYKKGSYPTREEIEQEVKDFYDEYFPKKS